MHGFQNIAVSLGLMTLAVTNTMAVQVTFKRYSQPNCDTQFHIAKDTHLHNPHCKTFDHHEPPFESFMADPEDDISDVTNKKCQVVVFEAKDCQGKGYTMDDLKVSQNRCGNPSLSSGYTINGRSVKIQCEDRPKTILTLTPTSTPSPTRVIQIETVLPSSKSSTSSSKSMEITTITLYPKPSGCGECNNN
ncbi:hypothetical protein LTR85_004967 [Meristemomyces frigidus]|nr:hypothetical protein LTR85_004967 [Meristemomyces frigidus]